MGNGTYIHRKHLGVTRLDWNKTKTIFIVVFSILNVFLYSLYVTQRSETLNVKIQGNVSIEDSLRFDNITYGELPKNNEDSYFVSAEIAVFSEEELLSLQNQSIEVEDGTHLYSTIKKPIMLNNTNGEIDFNSFLAEYVLHGEEYVLWKRNDKERQATFFQHVSGQPIYFNQNAMLTLFWNESDEVIRYEQRMFGEFVSFNRKKDVLPPLQAINTLNTRNYLKPDSKVLSMKLGYSTLAQLTKTQVFAPTWYIQVELSSGELEDFFINANDGKIIEFQSEKVEHKEE